MAEDESPDRQRPSEENLTENPFELPPIEGIPFSKNSEEARAIREVIEQADRERAGRTQN